MVRKKPRTCLQRSFRGPSPRGLSQRWRRLLRSSALLSLPAVLCFSSLLPATGVHAEPERVALTLTASGGRELDVQLLHAGGCEECALVVFSHGAYATPARYDRLLLSWARAGFLVAAPLHVDSEEYEHRDDFDASAALAARLEDIALLAGGEEFRDALEQRGLAPAPGLVAAGHSYGALIAQVAAGAGLDGMAAVPPALQSLQPAVAGVVALSPPGPMKGLVVPGNWATVRAPMLVVTGTTDVLPGFIDDWTEHLAAYDAAASAPSYALVFQGQDHYFNGAFGRPKARLEDASKAALGELNRAVIGFMRAVVEGAPPPAELWHTLSSETVEARARVGGTAPAASR